MITIEIENHHDVAGRRSWLARLFGRLASTTVCRVVEEEVAGRIRSQLESEGVEAQVTVE